MEADSVSRPGKRLGRFTDHRSIDVLKRWVETQPLKDAGGARRGMDHRNCKWYLLWPPLETECWAVQTVSVTQ